MYIVHSRFNEFRQNLITLTGLITGRLASAMEFYYDRVGIAYDTSYGKYVIYKMFLEHS